MAMQLSGSVLKGKDCSFFPFLLPAGWLAHVTARPGAVTFHHEMEALCGEEGNHKRKAWVPEDHETATPALDIYVREK